VAAQVPVQPVEDSVAPGPVVTPGSASCRRVPPGRSGRTSAAGSRHEDRRKRDPGHAVTTRAGRVGCSPAGAGDRRRASALPGRRGTEEGEDAAGPVAGGTAGLTGHSVRIAASGRTPTDTRPDRYRTSRDSPQNANAAAHIAALCAMICFGGIFARTPRNTPTSSAAPSRISRIVICHTSPLCRQVGRGS